MDNELEASPQREGYPTEKCQAVAKWKILQARHLTIPQSVANFDATGSNTGGAGDHLVRRTG
jgi:hypothetical protein